MPFWFKKLKSDCDGTATIEYALIATLISIIAIVAFTSMMDQIEARYFDLIASIAS